MRRQRFIPLFWKETVFLCICASINKAIVAKDLIVKPGGDLEITDFIDLEI